MTAEESDKYAGMIADEIIRLINLFGYILHLAVEKDSDDKEHHADR